MTEKKFVHVTAKKTAAAPREQKATPHVFPAHPDNVEYCTKCPNCHEHLVLGGPDPDPHGI